jgi:hypothetical protein
VAKTLVEASVIAARQAVEPAALPGLTFLGSWHTCLPYCSRQHVGKSKVAVDRLPHAHQHNAAGCEELWTGVGCSNGRMEQQSVGAAGASVIVRSWLLTSRCEVVQAHPVRPGR